MTDIATISLKVNTADLERGQQKLKSFQQTAENVDRASSNLGSGLQKVSLASLRNGQTFKAQKNELNDLLNKINPTNKAFAELDKISSKLAASHKKGLLSLDQYIDYNTILEQSRDKLTKMSMALTAEGKALLAQEATSKRAKVAADSFLVSLKQQSETVGKTRTEMLELQAAQMGVSQQAAPMIARLKQQEKAFMSGALTVGQYRYAMRMLPMQMTDVVTSLASGMPAWMVLVQQGGQIKDSFGGVSNALKAMGSILTPTRLLMGGLAGSTVAAAIAAYQGANEFDQFNKQLSLTGGYAGKTAGQLQDLAKRLSANGITQHAMADSLAKVVGSGTFKGNELEIVASAAAKMKYAVGKEVDETIKEFEKLKQDPLSAIEALNDKMHFMTAAQYEYINSLVERGEKEKASTAAVKILAAASDAAANAVVRNLGYMEKAANAVVNSLKYIYDRLRDIGRPDTLEDALQKAQKVKKLLANDNTPWASWSKKRADDEIAGLTAVKNMTELLNNANNERIKYEEQQIDNIKTRTKYEKEYATEAEKVEKKIKAINKAYADGAISAANRDKYIATEREKLNKSKAATYKVDYGSQVNESNNAAILALQAQLKVLREHRDVTAVISAERRKLWQMEAKFSIIESVASKRKLTNHEQALIAQKESVLASQRELAILGDKVEAEKRLNTERQRQQKRLAEIAARTKAMMASAGLSDRQYQQQIAIEKVETPAEKEALKKHFQQEESLRGNWEKGVKKGFAEFQDQATNAYANVANITQFAFEGISHSLSDFLLTGKANFADFTKSVLEMIVKIMTQMAILKAMESAFGGTSFGGFLGLKGHASGGYTGDGNKYDIGGYVHKGEFVFTKGATSRLGVANLYRLMNNTKKVMRPVVMLVLRQPRCTVCIRLLVVLMSIWAVFILIINPHNLVTQIWICVWQNNH
ncbi:phage tail tape measure protein [Arsenophonus apicola]|uniref:phage tail tape measure protein n=1 Tax=Arsenophonus apicola TaxID=2879119 RepID=UPI0038792185